MRAAFKTSEVVVLLDFALAVIPLIAAVIVFATVHSRTMWVSPLALIVIVMIASSSARALQRLLNESWPALKIDSAGAHTALATSIGLIGLVTLMAMRSVAWTVKIWAAIVVVLALALIAAQKLGYLNLGL